MDDNDSEQGAQDSEATYQHTNGRSTTTTTSAIPTGASAATSVVEKNAREQSAPNNGDGVQYAANVGTTATTANTATAPGTPEEGEGDDRDQSAQRAGDADTQVDAHRDNAATTPTTASASSVGSGREQRVQSLEDEDQRVKERDKLSAIEEFLTAQMDAEFDGGQSLAEAAKGGDVAGVRRLLADGVEVDWMDKRGRTALGWAAFYGRLDVLRELAASRAQLDVQDRAGYSPLYCAAQEGHVAVVEELCSQGAQVDITEPDGATPLYVAAQKGHTAAVNALVQGGAKIDMAMDEGATPLYIAAQMGHTAAVNALLQGGAKIYLAMDDDTTPLYIAAQEGHTAAVNALLQGGANIDWETHDGATPLFTAAQEGHIKVVSTLLHNNASVNRAEMAVQTPLTAAADHGHAAIVRMLLTAGASQLVPYDWPIPLVQAVQRKDMAVVYALVGLGEEFNKGGSEDFTPLQWASLAEKDEVVVYLLDHDKDTRKPFKLNWSHLHQVAESGGVKATRILIQRHVAVDARDDELRTPLHLAATKDHGEVAQVLVDNGADINILDKNQEAPLHVCARYNAASVANALIEKGADVYFADSCSSLVRICAKYDSVDVARLILETKVDKETKGGEDEETALHICAKRDLSAVAELLLKNGANVEAIDVRSRTPLHICAFSGNVSMAELLIRRGCNVNSLDHSNNTPLHLCQDDSIAVAQCLLKHGADETARNTDNETPLHNAVKLQQVNLSRILVGIREGWTMEATDAFDALQWASASHDVRKVKMLLDNPKTDISRKDSLGRNALDIAVHTKNVAAAKALVGLDDTWNVPQMEGLAPLHWSAAANNVILMNAYLSDPDINVNMQDSSMGRTALHLTCISNSSATADALLKANACCQTLSTLGEPPLFTALHNKSSDVFLLLLRHQFDVRDSEENTVLHLAAHSGDSKIMGRVLAECAGNTHFFVEATNNEGDSALHLAIKEGHIDAVSLLVQYGANCTVRNGEGNNALDLAVLQKNTAAAKRLMGLDNAWSAPGMVGFTSLHWCAVANNEHLVNYYLEDAKINMDIQDSMGRTALHLTGTTDAFQVADLLLTNKANVELKDKDGFPPLFTAYYYKSREVFSRLLRRRLCVTGSDGDTVVHITARLDDSKSIHRFLTEDDPMFKFLVARKNNKGDSALHVAASENSVAAARALLQSGADTSALNTEKEKPVDLVGEKWNMLYLLKYAEIGIVTTGTLGEIHQRVADGDDTLTDRELIYTLSSNSEGLSILHVAVIKSRCAMVKRLLDLGVDVNVQDNNGRSPLHLTTLQFQLNITQMLLQGDYCDVDIKDKLGRSPLHWAASEQNCMLIECLLKAGTNASLQAEDYKTPVHLLLENTIDNDVNKRENEESISLLLDHIHRKEGQEATADLAASAVSSLIMSENHKFRTEKINHVLSKVKGHDRFFGAPCYLSSQTKGLLKEVSERWGRYTVLMALVECYTPDMLRKLLLLTTNETINSTNFLQQNTLHLLAEKHVDGGGTGNVVEKVSILTKNGLDPRQKDINGRTALHVTCQHQDLQLVKCLLDNLSKPPGLGSLNSKDIIGRTALHYLIRNANVSSQNEDWKEIINQFISLGADPNVYDCMGGSALECGYDRQVDSIMAHTGSLIMKFPQIAGTKLGLLKVDTRNKLPTSIGGNNVVNEHDISAWISSLRTKYSSNSATDYFLKSTQFGPVGMTYTNRANADRISRFVTEICQTTLSRMHVKGHIELSGSMAEGTKVGPVDEMDFLLRLTDMEESIKVTGIECTGGSPFAKLSASEGELKSADKALDVLEDFLQSLKGLSSLPALGMSLEDIKRNKLKVFTLVLKCAQRSGSDILVTIDLVPCIIKELDYNSNWKPSVRRVRGEGHDVKQFPLLMNMDGFQVSFSELEHKAIREMESYQRNAYMLLKAMRTDEICPRLTSMKLHESTEDIVPSYVFKVGLLWVVDPECKRAKYLESSDFSSEDLSELDETDKIRHLALEVLNLVSASKRDTIPRYFCPSIQVRLTHNCQLLCRIMRGVLKE